MQQTKIKQNFIWILWAQARGIVDGKWKSGIWSKTNKGTCKEAFRAKLFTSRIYGLDTETLPFFLFRRGTIAGAVETEVAREIEFLFGSNLGGCGSWNGAFVV